MPTVRYVMWLATASAKLKLEKTYVGLKADA